MDPRHNPFAPGAGTPPPDLVGRDETLERASIALDRIRAGRSTRSQILYGLRGVGKTVLLSAIRMQAEASGIQAVAIEAPENRSLPAMLIPALRAGLLKLDRIKQAGDGVQRALRALAGLAKLKFRYEDIEFGIELDAEPGLADSGDLDSDLIDLIEAIGIAAQERKTAFVLCIDELQYVPEEQLAALIAALHKASQARLPVALVAAGLPQLLGRLGRAKSYSERLFEFVAIGPLPPEAARLAIQRPLRSEGANIQPDALDLILEDTQGYPYFLQEWGKHAWDQAVGSPITRGDVDFARQLAVRELDNSFFRVRFDRLTPSERRYLRAMAELGPGPHRSGDVASVMGKQVTQLGPVRNGLIAKGMLYSPSYGDTGFTVPLFDAFMRRVMPTLDL